ncbi:acetyltransferase [Sphingomonas panaciterrae]|uniref:acetyltransferase n=1 Tax=Sphingomonas panaciterrae TaxID=1462999 RepID=UPI002FEF4776
MKRFCIFGSGGFGRELVKPARMALAASGNLNGTEIVFVVDEPSETVFDGIREISPNQVTGDDDVVFAIGDSSVRKTVAERFSFRAGSLIAPTAIIGPEVELGEGAVLCDHTMITASARIGRHFQANIYSYVAHDCVVGDYVTFAPRVSCNGRVHIGDGAYIGTGAVIRPGVPGGEPLLIGEGATIGMGAVVTKNVPAGAVVVGNPARSR